METDSSRLVFDIFREHDTRKVGGDFNFTLDFKWYGCYTSQRTCPVLAKIAGRKTGFQLTSKLVYLAVNLRCDNTPKVNCAGATTSYSTQSQSVAEFLESGILHRLAHRMECLKNNSRGGESNGTAIGRSVMNEQ